MRHGKRRRHKKKSDESDYKGFMNFNQANFEEYVTRLGLYQWNMGNKNFPEPTSVSGGARKCKNED